MGFAEALAVVLEHARASAGASAGAAERAGGAAGGRGPGAGGGDAGGPRPAAVRPGDAGWVCGAGGGVAAGARLRVAGQVRAGEVWTGAAVAAGEAVEIMTGAPVPEGADAVVMVEHVEQADGTVRLVAGTDAAGGGEYRGAGSEARREMRWCRRGR